MGGCMGGQYAPEFVWYIANGMWDCDYGIQLASDGSLGTGRYQFFIGNVITRIHDSDGGFEPGSAWQNCGISLPGGTNRYVIENSINDVDSAVCVAGGVGRLYLFDNLMQGVRADGYHVIFDSSTVANRTVSGSNLFAPNFRINLGGAKTLLNAPTPVLRGQNSIVANVGWRAPDIGDFRLLLNSPARDVGLMNSLGVWEFFKNRYGVDLAMDLYGAARDSSPDVGAAEYR